MSTAAADRGPRGYVVREWLDEAVAAEAEMGPHGHPVAVEYELGARPGEFVVQLPGERKLRTAVSVLVGDHSLSVSAFVVRNPDENHEARLPLAAGAQPEDAAGGVRRRLQR